MTKQKIIIYTIIFIVLVTSVQVWKNVFLKNPADNFNPMCKNVLAQSCQIYINQITQEKKYEETLLIQLERLRLNKQILSFYKRKITNKQILKAPEKEADALVQASMEKDFGKKDYFLFKTAQITVQDILVDSFVIAQIYKNELSDKKSAVKILKSAKKIAQDNPYMFNQQKLLEYIDLELEKLIN